MNDSTLSENPALEEAFAAYVQAQENGQPDAARQMLRDHPGLAEEVATYYALCARVPRPWDSRGNTHDGQTIGDFELLHELGRGGEGVVYKARQKALRRLVAVKVMRKERFADARDIDRFRRDSTLLASLQHPNIVQIYYAGESETGPYFAMELLEDGSLKRKLADGWLPTPKQAAELVRVLAEAMQCAHDKQIVHRDLKPANILLGRVVSGGMVTGDYDSATHHSLLTTHQPKIVDFGLAKKLDAGDSMTQSGAILGTASYMSPEQANGQRADFACDIYGLGAILYELLTGRPPFVGATLVETLQQVRHKEPLPVFQLNPTAPRDLEVICLKCLDKDPLKRYASAGDLAGDLKRFLRGEPILARLPGITERAVQMIRRQQFGRNATAWGWVLTLAGCINLVGYSVQAWCIESEQPERVLWGAFLAPQLVVAFAIWCAMRRYRLGRGDRQGIVYMIAAIAGPILVAIMARPMDPTAWLSVYPIIAVLLGIIAYIQGPLYWGGNYLVGLGYIALAFVMKTVPTWAPMLFALYLSSTLIPLGLYLLRPRRPPDIAK